VALDLADVTQNLQTRQNRRSIRLVAQSPVAPRLGRLAEGTSLGESAYGLAIECRLSTGHASKLQDERGCNPLRTETGL